MIKRYIVLVISVFINALGNSLMLKGNVGATPWSSSYGNMSNCFNITPGTASIIVAVIIYLVSKIIGRDFKIRDALICVLITFAYGGLIDTYLFILGPDQSQYLVVNYIYAFMGIICASCAVSLAIQANVGYMALDDFAKNLKKHVCKGNIALSMLISSGIAVIVSITTGLFAGRVENITFLTLFFTFFFGVLISMFDKIIILKFADKN